MVDKYDSEEESSGYYKQGDGGGKFRYLDWANKDDDKDGFNLINDVCGNREYTCAKSG